MTKDRSVVALHGFMGVPQMWYALEPHLHTQALPLPGHGPEPWYPAKAGFTATVEAMLERCPKRFVLMGYSLGARVALGMGCLAPERVEALVLIGVHPGLENQAERLQRRQWDLSQVARLKTQSLEQFVLAWEQLPVFASQHELTAEIQAHQRQQRLLHTRKGLAWAMDNLGLGSMPSWWPYLEQLTMPVHLLVGARDRKFVDLGQRAVSRLLDGRLSEIPGAGHNPVLEQPGALVRYIAKELALGER